MDLKAKQDYLFTEIIEANYDPEVFQEYIEKEKGVNLEAYSMQELVAIVQRFKGVEEREMEELHEESKAEGTDKKQRQAVRQQQRNEKLGKMEQSLLQAENKKSDSFNTSTKVYHQFLKKHTVSKLYKKVFEAHESVRVKIRSYSKEGEQSILSSPYIMYLLETSNGWNVKRRFKDFQWLHAKLSAMYPGLPIPPIPKKTALRSFDDKHLEERMIFFESFVNRMLQIPEICSDEVFEEFLSVGSAQQFATCKERFEIRLGNNGNKIVSLKGDRVINMSEYAIDAKEAAFHNTSYEIIKNLNTQLTAFQKSIKAATERAFELSSTFAEAYRHFQGGKVGSCQILQLMGDFISELGYRLDGEYFFVKNNLQDYWSYQQKYQENLIAHISRINKEQYDILNKSKSLSIQENEADIEQAYSKNKSIGQYLSSKQLYRIKLSFLLDELDRHKSHDLGIVAKEWVSALQQYVGGIKELMLSGADQLTKGMCICEGKKLVEVQYLSTKSNIRESHIIPR